MAKIVKNNFANLLVILMIFVLMGGWWFSGFPQIWQNPRIPPEVLKASADQAAKTYSFPSNSEGWVNAACGAAGATCDWYSSDGSPENGSLREGETRKNKSGIWTWELSGITWEDLGVPANATVTSVDGSYNHKMATCSSCGTANTSGDLLIRDSGDTTTIATLETAISYDAATSWLSRDALVAQPIGASYQESNTGIILRLTGFLATPNSQGAQAILLQDEISLIITYTAVSISINRIGGDGIIVYGLVDLGGSTSTLPSAINDVETFQNDGTAAEQFSIKTSNAVNGTTWTVGTSPGTNIYTHSFATTTNGYWQILDTVDTYEVASSSVAVNGTLDFYMKIDAPTGTGGDYSQKNITITVFAEQAP